MRRVPFWTRPARGVNIGFSKFASLDNYGIDFLDGAQFYKVNTIQAAIVISINLLAEFNTRYYGYDRGGEYVTDIELEDFADYEYRRD